MITFRRFLAEQMSQQELAKKLEVDISEVEKLSSEELEVILKFVGNHDFKPDSDFDQKELAMGIKVEHEHTKNDIIAKLIAKDHLSEPGCENYYSALEKMEKQLKH